MESAGPGQPSRDTGLPPGVEVGPLGRRVVAHLIEALVPAIVAGVLVALLPGASGTTRGVLSIVGALVTVGWALAIWYLLAERAAGPGMRLMKLQLVGFYDGRPVGWIRVLLRALVFWALSATGIGLVIMLVFLVLHPRKQGWHDLVAKAVVIKERVLPPPAARPAVAQQASFTPEQAPALAPAPAPATAQPPAMAQPSVMAQTPVMAQPPAYGPVARYSPVPGGPPGPDPMGAPVSAPPAPQPLAPPPGLGSSVQSGPAYPPGPPSAPSAPPVAPPPRPADQARGPEVRPMSAPSAPPAAEPTPPTLEWYVVLDDGRRLVVDHLVLLGRNPRPAPGEEDAELIKIADETRTVSKLHLAVGVDPTGMFVVDRGSTNGSTVTTPGGATRRCTPGEVVYVSEGSIVSMGDHWLEIRRG